MFPGRQTNCCQGCGRQQEMPPGLIRGPGPGGMPYFATEMNYGFPGFYPQPPPLFFPPMGPEGLLPPPPPFLAACSSTNASSSSPFSPATQNSEDSKPAAKAEKRKSSSRSKSRESNRKDEKKRKEREKEREDRKRKESSKARTLGELVEEAKRRKKLEKPEDKEEESASDPEEESIKEEQKERTVVQNNADDLPILTDEDLRQPVVLNPDAPFDPETMKIKQREASVPVLATDNYVKTDGCVYSLPAARAIEQKFRTEVLDFIKEAKASQESPSRPPTPPMHDRCKCGSDNASSSESSSSSSEDEDEHETDVAKMGRRKRNRELLRREVERKQKHPAALSPDICFNEAGMSNDGPVCRCSKRTRTEGIRHNVFVGEKHIEPCNPLSNNADRLHHYVLQVNHAVNPQASRITQIRIGRDIFDFKGFSVLFHRPLPKVFPKMPISRWNTDIDFEFVEEPIPECFTVGELENFYSYLVDNTLDLFELPRFPMTCQEEEKGTSCPVYHVFPRFIGSVEGKQTLLPMVKVLEHFENVFRPVLTPMEAEQKMICTDDEFHRFSLSGKHQLVMNPHKRPSAIRVDSYTRNRVDFPHLTQSTIRPMAYVSQQTEELQVAQKKLAKMKKVQKMKKNPTASEQRELSALQKRIDDLKAINSSLRNVNVMLSLEPFYRTGFFSDVVSHVLTLSIACHHARLHISFEKLEEMVDYKFSNRALLELAMIHPSFKLNYGMNSDHAKNTLINCGFRRKFNTDKMEDMRRLGGSPRMAEMIVSGGLRARTAQVVHNERLEYLGDAVVEMIVTNRLFFLLPHHQEGGLATYRSAMVQNRNLASLAKNIGLQHWLLFTHGPDLCHEADFRHALANAFEAIMGAIYLDSSAEHADRIFSQAMYGGDPETKKIWDNINEHQLKTDFPDGDRHMIEEVPCLQKFTELEERIGVQFKHIRLLAKAFTRRSVPWNELTKGHNQRLEWLGDTVLQLIVSDYLYRHFPYHHEGHLSLLRTCIVSNKTQAVICDEVGLCEFVIKGPKAAEGELKMKDKADLVESLLGALFVDRGWDYCKAFIRVMFLPRLKHFLIKKRWSDEKSQLQQACLSLRRIGERDSETPVYRVLSAHGPTNSRIYRVGVYFRKTKLAEGVAPTLHAAEMEAAKKALIECQELLPDLEAPSSSRRSRSGRPSNTTPTGPIPSLLSTPILPPMFLPQPPYPMPIMAQPMPLMGPYFIPQMPSTRGNDAKNPMSFHQ